MVIVRRPRSRLVTRADRCVPRNQKPILSTNFGSPADSGSTFCISFRCRKGRRGYGRFCWGWCGLVVQNCARVVATWGSLAGEGALSTVSGCAWLCTSGCTSLWASGWASSVHFVVHFGRAGSSWAVGDGFRVGVLGDHFFDVELDLFLGRRGRGRGLDDGERGLQADGGRGLGVGEEVVEGLNGEVDLVFDFFAEEEGAVVLGVREGMLERERVAPPVIDGVAVHAGLLRGGDECCAARQGADDSELLSGESVIHRNHFLVST